MLTSRIMDTLCPLLKQGEQAVLVTVISKSGSTPCLAGSKMLVRDDGGFYGTIGGGSLEAHGLERAARLFQTGISQRFAVELTDRDAANMHMICGGRVEMLLELVSPDSATIEVFTALQDALAINERCFLVSWLGPDGDAITRIERCLVREDRSLNGAFHHPPAWLDELVERSQNSPFPVLTVIEGQLFLVEGCYTPSTIYLFGAGHVSQQVAYFATKVDFQVVVLDDRPEFACRERFPTVDGVQVIDSFEDCLTGLIINQDSYVVIVTRGHDYDKTVLDQVLNTDARYIGMLGSKKKSAQIRRSLVAEGFEEEIVNAVHCPIGLQIGAQTPVEIAVSIVAELIQARATHIR